MSDEESKNILRAVLAISISTPPKLGGQSELPATPCSAIRDYKEDHRPPKGGWADGHYMNRCYRCHQGFMGDKRACVCADCAYADSPNDQA